MKLEDLKNSYIIPEKPQIDIKSIYIEPKKEKFKFRRLSLQLSLSFVFLLFLGVAFFLMPSNKSKPPIIRTPVVLKGAELDHFSAVSTSLLYTEVGKSILMSGEVSNSLFEEKIAFINPYINVFEVFVGTTKPVITLQTEGVLEGYTHYEQIVFTDAFGNESIYHFHYIVDEENGDDEKETFKEGVVIHNGEKTYMEIEIESESDEIEKEYLIYTDISRKEEDYIKLEIEKDLKTGEQTYKYSIYKDDDEVIKVLAELEEDDGDVELFLEVEIKDVLKFKLEIYKLENVFKGSYEIDNDDDEEGTVEIKIVKDNNVYYYEYKIANKTFRKVRSY